MGHELELEQLFGELIGLSSDHDRRLFLDGISDSGVRARLETLLHADRNAGSFLGNTSAPTVDFNPGAYRDKQIGPYRLREVIGEGGMGVVYVAEQSKPLRRKVALKVIKPGMDSKAVMGRFEAERNALALMNHPHVAKVLDAGTTDDGQLPFFVMELVNGIPITEYCDAQKLAVKARLALFADVCRAIHHAHQKGIIHRDIKPSNVLVTELDGKPIVKVIDFGVSKALNQTLTEHSIYTAFQTIVGTPIYMSPEQATFSAVDVDTRSDVYSLGVLLYELVTGTTPFGVNDLKEAVQEEVFRMIREQEPPRPSNRISSLRDTQARISHARSVEPSQLGRIVKGDLDWITMKALSKERGRRYDSANRFADDVERFLGDDVVEARPPSLVYKISKFCRRNKPLVVSSGAIALALLMGLVVVLQKNAVQRELIEQTEALVSKLRRIHADSILEDVLSGDRESANQQLDRYRNTLPDAEVRSDSILNRNQAMINLFGNGDERVHAREQLSRLHAAAPQDVLTQSLYIISLRMTGLENDYWINVERLIHITPRTFEERLFRGFAVSQGFPQVAQADLQLAVEMEPSSAIGRCLLAQSTHDYSLKAMDRSQRQTLAREAVRQAELGSNISRPHNLIAMTTRLRANAGLLHSYLGEDPARLNEQECKDSIKVVQSLIAHRVPEYDWRFHAAQLDALQVLREHGLPIPATSEGPLLTLPNAGSLGAETIIYLLQLLYESDELERCAEISRRFSSRLVPESPLSFLPEVEWAFQQTGSIAKVRQEIVARVGPPTSSTKLASLPAWPVLKIIGEDDLAEQHARALIEYLPKHETHFPAAKQIPIVLRWLLDGRPTSVEHLLQQVDDANAVPHCALVLGIDALSRGEREEAKRMFLHARSSPAFEAYDYGWATTFAKRMEDAAWPGWLTQRP